MIVKYPWSNPRKGSWFFLSSFTIDIEQNLVTEAQRSKRLKIIDVVNSSHSKMYVRDRLTLIKCLII